MQLVRGVHGFAAQKPGGFVRARLFHDALWAVEGLEQGAKTLLEMRVLPQPPPPTSRSRTSVPTKGIKALASSTWPLQTAQHPAPITQDPAQPQIATTANLMPIPPHPPHPPANPAVHARALAFQPSAFA